MFFKFKETGNLKIDKIFFESYYPILFTCKNENNSIFLCINYQRDLKYNKWLIVNILPKTIIELLKNKITMEDSLLKDKKLKYIIIYNNRNKICQIKEIDNIKNNIDLPAINEFLDAERNEFLEEIKYFENWLK